MKKEKNKICRLLFLGVEWERKGGQIALDTFYALQNNGMQVQLKIIGCQPPLHIKDKNVTVIPFLNKNIKEEAQQLYNILLQTDFLLLPTRAMQECFCRALNPFYYN
ncbi:MAG: hypothetical protein IPG38_01460 [Chitinophagaceae bacterium]|nr:hypothetical protein [Chitinophagaceae bacterium]